jgi:YspA, cpYpsA-related SLOG family
MKTIIAGSRDGVTLKDMNDAIAFSNFHITEVVSGTARGVDRWGEAWAKSTGVPVKRFPANWSIGRQAGMVRNVEMALYANALIAVWDGESNGTRHMIEVAKRNGLKVFVFNKKERHCQ